MKITLENTTKIVELNGVTTRIWEGRTDSGIEVHAYVALIAHDNDADASQFEAELRAAKAPSPTVQAIDARMIL